MNIRRDNYESWFMDYLDGRLTAGQVEILMAFLELNQDLRKELEGMEMARLDAEEVSYDLKAALLKPGLKPDHLFLRDHFEEYCLLSIEKQLSGPEEEMLRTILDEDMEKQGAYNLYQSTLLVADEKILYPGKSRLKKRFIQVPGVRIALSSTAAVAVLLLAFSLMFRKSGKPLADREIPSAAVREKQTEEVISSVTPATVERSATAATPVTPAPATTPVTTATTGTGIRSESGSAAYRRDQGIQARGMQEQVIISKIEPIGVEPLNHPGETDGSLQAERLWIPGMNDRLPLVEYPGGSTVEYATKNRPGKRPEKRFSFWNLADAGLRRISEMAEEPYSLERETDNQGNTCRITFETPVFGISAPMKSPDIPRE
jgi:hypothetical protein